jgi:hypothetical protein
VLDPVWTLVPKDTWNGLREINNGSAGEGTCQHCRQKVDSSLTAGGRLAACLVPTNASVATTNAPSLTRCGCLVPACGAWTMWTPSSATYSRGNGHGGTKATSCGAMTLGSGGSNARFGQRRCGTGQRAAALIGALRANQHDGLILPPLRAPLPCGLASVARSEPLPTCRRTHTGAARRQKSQSAAPQSLARNGQ